MARPKSRLRAAVSRVATLFRMREWWEEKLAPLFGSMYCAAYVIGTPPRAVLWQVVHTLPAVVAAGIWAHVVNDLSDQDDDRRAGKPNRMLERSPRFKAALLLGCGGSAAAFALSLRGAPIALALYLGIYLVWAAYSLRPLRLKERGVLGALADATGAFVLPHAFAVAMVVHASGRAPGVLWLACLGALTAAVGLRGIVYHQLLDLEADRAAGVTTWAATQERPERLGRFIAWGVFPVEVAALVGLLWCSGSPIAFALLALHSLVAWMRGRVAQDGFRVVRPRGRVRLALFRYYELFYPWAFLAAIATRSPRDAAPLLLAHYLLFPRLLPVFVRELATDARAWLFQRPGSRRPVDQG